ncbi:hypothetical protein C8Q80DRAFT_1358849 [Daedaleopsis nitida]|nr:hypothetical protein C8Q80DRAFT_1358849 [Daedaleopsis nitida]
MARGAASPAPNPIPKVSFVKVSDEFNQKNPGVHDNVAKTYGYNDGSEFEQPKHYIRYIEPLESDLAVQVEYDMDEQDQEWLDAVNSERWNQGLDKASYEAFEIVMDRLEKEWFDLTKNLPKPDMALPSEDSTCAICDDSEGENTNAIVFCDGCNLAVHQDCYGVPYIPEGQWLCRKCTVSPENPVSCILCPNEGGAFKQTVSGDWVHLLCAIWIPETSVANEVFMEPIHGVEKISKQRWKLRCSICEVKYGACIQCTKTSCFTAFHATCARKEKFLMPMKASQGSEAPTLACHCEKHLPREQQEIRAAMHRAADQADGGDGDGIHPSPKSNKTMRAYNKQYKPGPPLVPKIIVNRILQYISKVPLRQKPDFVHTVCKYWSLKREARRGAPLLKRLHLEPWTALSGSKQQTDEEKAVKLDHTKRLRLDLERLRKIAEDIVKREVYKRTQVDAIQSVLRHFFFSHEAAMRFTFENIISADRTGYFKSPVNKADVPDYYDIIKTPMCWDAIDQKLDRHAYLDLDEFKRDLYLVINNAMTYNQPNTQFYKTAARLQGHIEQELGKLDEKLGRLPTDSGDLTASSVPPQLPADATEVVDEKPQMKTSPRPDASPTPFVLPPIGDLEPPLHILNLLVSEESIRQDTDIIVITNPTQSLLNYELPLIRPPAPPQPPPRAVREKPQKPPRTKPKVDRKTILERKKLERKLALDASPGFRAPRTRSAIAAAAAFEAEATGSSQTPEAEAEQPVAGPSSSAAPPAAGAQGKTRKPRKSTMLPPPDLVEDVDSRQSFKMFEVGWILPPEQKRGGRVAVERPPPPPPRKRVKTSHEKTRLSTAIVVPDPSEPPPPAEDASVSSEVKPGPSETSQPSQADPPDVQPLTLRVAIVPEPQITDAVPAMSSGPPEPIHPPSEHNEEPEPVPADLQPAATPVAEPVVEHGPIQETGLEEHPKSLERLSPSADIRSPSETEPVPAYAPKPDVPLMSGSSESLVNAETQAPEVVSMEVDEPMTSGTDEVRVEEPVIDIEPPEPPGTSPSHEDSEQVPPAGEEIDQGESIEAAAPAEEPQPQVQLPPQSKPQTDPATGSQTVPDADREREPAGKSTPPPESEPEPEPDRGPRRIIIIEELDTPAIRRKKYLRRKAEREAAREAAAAEVAAAERRERGIADDAMDVDSDLTDLSDLEDEPQPVVPPPRARTPVPVLVPMPAPASSSASASAPKPPKPVSMSASVSTPGPAMAPRPAPTHTPTPRPMSTHTPTSSPMPKWKVVPRPVVKPRPSQASLVSAPATPALTAPVTPVITTPATPILAPSTPVPAPATPVPAPTTPVPAPTTPVPAPTTPVSAATAVPPVPPTKPPAPTPVPAQSSIPAPTPAPAPAPAPALAPPPRPVPKPPAVSVPAPVTVTVSSSASGPATIEVRPPPVVEEPGAIALGPRERLEGGTLVWAKGDSSPWWPAVVFENDDPEIPKAVRTRAPNLDDPTNVLVRFYKNANHKWAWVKVWNLRYLGEDEADGVWTCAPRPLTAPLEAAISSKLDTISPPRTGLPLVWIAVHNRSLRWSTVLFPVWCLALLFLLTDTLAALDAQMLAPSSTYQRWRNITRRTECRNAYQDALAEMEAEDEVAVIASKANLPQTRVSPGVDLVPAAMGADSPMTDVE